MLETILHLGAVRLNSDFLNTSVSPHWWRTSGSGITGILNAQRWIRPGSRFFQTGSQWRSGHRVEGGPIGDAGDRGAHGGHTARRSRSIPDSTVRLSGGIRHRDAVATAWLLEARIIERGGTARR